MPRYASTQPTTPSSALTVEQVERVRAALRYAAGEYEGLELTIEELEERIAPGLNATN